MREEKGEKVPREGEEDLEGWPAKGAKGKRGRVKTDQPLFKSEAWGPPQFQEKRAQSEKAILGALGEFRGILGAALGGPGINKSSYSRIKNCLIDVAASGLPPPLSGLKNANAKRRVFFERKGAERKPWPRGKSLNRKKRSQCVFGTLAF